VKLLAGLPWREISWKRFRLLTPFHAQSPRKVRDSPVKMSKKRSKSRNLFYRNELLCGVRGRICEI
jgi:hypothetical protein